MKRLPIRPLPAFLLALAVAATPMRAAGSPKLVRAVRVAYGIRFTMSMPHRTYAADALARVTLSMQNISHRDIRIVVPGWCGFGGQLWVENMDSTGLRLYPPALPDDPNMYDRQCPGSFPTTAFHPGEVARQTALVPLRGNRLVEVVPIDTGPTPTPSGGFQAGQGFLRATDLSVHLVPSVAPPVAIITTPVVEAAFTPPAGAAGPLYYQELFTCQGADGAVYRAGTVRWQPVAGSVVRMLPAPVYCPTVLRWEIVGGWVSYPLGTARYVV